MVTRIDPTRRDFLARLAGLGVLAARPDLLLAQQPRLPTRLIPSTKEPLPIIGLGSSGPVLAIPEAGTGPITGVLRSLLQYGARVVDTSPRTPEDIDARFGAVLQDPEFRDRFFLTTKINTDGAENGIRQFRQTQRLFGRRTLDLVQVESLRDVQAHWPNLRSWKESGEARYIGVTTATTADHGLMEAFLQREPVDFMHVNYSVVETEAEARLLPLARDKGLAVVTNRPFMNGTYFRLVAGKTLPDWAAEFDCVSWAQFTLKYVVSNPVITCAFAESSDPEHMDENLRSGLGRLPDEATRRRMRELVRSF